MCSCKQLPTAAQRTPCPDLDLSSFPPAWALSTVSWVPPDCFGAAGGVPSCRGGRARKGVPPLDCALPGLFPASLKNKPLLVARLISYSRFYWCDLPAYGTCAIAGLCDPFSCSSPVPLPGCVCATICSSRSLRVSFKTQAVFLLMRLRATRMQMVRLNCGQPMLLLLEHGA